MLQRHLAQTARCLREPFRGVVRWEQGPLCVFEVDLRALPPGEGWSGLRLLGETVAVRLREALGDGRLEKELRRTLVSAVRELARAVGDEELLRLSSEELEQRGLQKGLQLGRREALLGLARELLGEEAARELQRFQDPEALQQALIERLRGRSG